MVLGVTLLQGLCELLFNLLPFLALFLWVHRNSTKLPGGYQQKEGVHFIYSPDFFGRHCYILSKVLKG